MLHKIVHTSSLLIVERLKDAKVVDALKILLSVTPSCELWIQMRGNINTTSWAADTTVYRCIPVLWAILGEISREMSKKGNWEDATVDLSSVLSTMRKLSISSIGDTDLGLCKSVVDGVSRDGRRFLPLIDCVRISRGIQTTSISRCVMYLFTNIPELSPFLSSVLTGMDSLDCPPSANLELPKSDLGDGVDIQSVTVYSFVWAVLFYEMTSQFLSRKILSNAESTNSSNSGKSLVFNFCPEAALREVEEFLKGTHRPPFHLKPRPLAANDAKDHLKALRCLRQLGDACNSLAQLLLSTTCCDFKASSPMKIKSSRQHVDEKCVKKLLYSEDFLDISLILFKHAADKVNCATALINKSCLSRKLAFITNESYVDIYGLLSKLQRRKVETETITADTSESYLLQGLRYCNKAHSMLGEKGSEIHIPFDSSSDRAKISAHISASLWDAISLEAANCYLTLGIRRKQILMQKLPQTEELVMLIEPPSLEAERNFVEPMEIALRIFTEQRSDRQVAAVNFHLGSFYCHCWPADNRKANARLELALKHYQSAHSYYSKFDVGPTLVAILCDMCNLYLSTFSTSENAIYSYCEQLNANRLSFGRTAQGFASFQPSEASEVVVSLLGGAFQCLLDSRFAFTPAAMSGRRSDPEIVKQIRKVTNLLVPVLMKLLKSLKLSLLNAGSTEIEVEARLKELRSSCAEVMRLQTLQQAEEECIDETVISSKLNEILDTLNKMDWLKCAVTYNKCAGK